MRRNSAAVLLLSTALFSFTAMAAFAKPYVSAKGYQITPASGWRTNTHQLMRTDLIIYAQRADSFAANLNVIVAPDTYGASLDQVRVANDANVRKMTPDYRQLSQGFVTIGGVKAINTVAEFKSGTPARMMYTHQVIAIKNRVAYTFTCTALASNHTKYEGAFSKMLQSIRWRKSAASIQ